VCATGNKCEDQGENGGVCHSLVSMGAGDAKDMSEPGGSKLEPLALASPCKTTTRAFIVK
jgi:hypothetical protein